MTRAEKRRVTKTEKKAKTATYNLTQAQLDAMVQERFNAMVREAKQQAVDDGVNAAMILLLTLPLEVLKDHYWQKTYQKRIPEFTEHVLEYYRRWQDGELDMDKLKQDLWDYAGIRLEEGE